MEQPDRVPLLVKHPKKHAYTQQSSKLNYRDQDVSSDGEISTVKQFAKYDKSQEQLGHASSFLHSNQDGERYGGDAIMSQESSLIGGPNL